MQETPAQTAIDEKLSGLSAEKRELLELLFGNESLAEDTPGESPAQPLSETEAKLKAIWEEVLNAGSINRQDNFFALGGDSLHCIQIVAKARRENLHFSTADLFEAQTIERLARKIGENESQTVTVNESESAPKFAESGLNSEELEELLRRI